MTLSPKLEGEFDMWRKRRDQFHFLIAPLATARETRSASIASLGYLSSIFMPVSFLGVCPHQIKPGVAPARSGVGGTHLGPSVGWYRHSGHPT